MGADAPLCRLGNKTRAIISWRPGDLCTRLTLTTSLVWSLAGRPPGASAEEVAEVVSAKAKSSQRHDVHWCPFLVATFGAKANKNGHEYLPILT